MIRGYHTLKPFRFWCQKVLPLVYDDSLSYYEVLSKTVDYINKTREDLSYFISNWSMPEVVDDYNDFNNTDKVYLYVGEQAGYNKNHWYYYDGSAWVDGGLYGSADIDDELSDTSENAVQNKVITEHLRNLEHYVTPQMYGAYADGLHDDREAMQEAINSGKPVYLPNGTYLVNGTITLSNNLTMIGQSHNAVIKVFRNGETKQLSISGGEVGNAVYATEYNGLHDIYLANFTFDMNESDFSIGGNIGLSHNKNVRFYHVYFANAYCEHYVDIAGCSDVTFESCIVDCQHYYNYDKDVFNIDWAWQTGFPHYGTWDNTPNKNIEFIDCEFNDSDNTFIVGTHSAPANPTNHENISLINCKINRCNKIVNSAFWNGVIIDGCYIEDTGEQEYYPIYLYNASNIIFKGNTVKDCSYYLLNAVSATRNNYYNALITNNILINCANSVFRFNRFVGATISSNVFKDSGYPAELIDSAKINIFDNNTERNPVIDGSSTNITCISNNEINQTFEMTTNSTAQLNSAIMTSKLVLIEATRYHHVGSCILSPSRMINNAVALYKASPSGGDVILDISSEGVVTMTTGHDSVTTYVTFKRIM